MILCAACTMESADEGLCPHHWMAAEEQWAEGNRILCDFLHRRIVPTRLPPGERENDAVTEHAIP